MGIQNFPTALQPIIQQNFLEREFREPLQSKVAYRSIADREVFPNKIGETITKTRAGLKNPVTTPMSAAGNTNLDNGLTPSTFSVEQYTLSIAEYADTIDLNIVNQKVGLAEQFLKNARVNGTQARQSLDRLARNALFNAYLGGQTRVRVTLGAPAATISVDDIRGFQTVLVNGQMVAVSGTNTVTGVVVGSNTYTLTGAAADGSNVSTSPGGISGTLTFSTNVTVADGTALNAVSHPNGSSIFRPSGRATTAALTGTDILTMGILLDAQAQLRNNAPLESMNMKCFLNNKSMRQLFADPDFKVLFQGQYGSKEFVDGMVFSLLGIDFVPTTETFVQTLGSVTVQRPVLVIPGALVEGDFAGMGTEIQALKESDGLIQMIDDVCMVTREPLDRLQQIIAQSWYWIGGFTAPSDATTNLNIIPTASNAYFKRAVVLETA
jgi:hypothetical protein